MKEKYLKFYYESKDKIAGYRLAIVDYALKTNISVAARHYKTTRFTVRKWVNRFDGTLQSLEDHSKRPHNITNVVSISDIKKLDLECKRLHENEKKIVGSYIKRDLGLPYALPTINKYLSKLGYKKKKQNRKQKKRNLSEIKKEMRSFEKIQVDVKYLNDIPEFYREYYKLDLPKYQITARCVKSGALFIGYAREKTNINTAVFIYKLLSHLKDNGIDTSKTTIQTDNGTEFRNVRGNKSTLFQDIVDHFNTAYYNIPAGAKTWQSDVETSHRLIEDEFYAYKIFRSRKDFFSQAYEYVKSFNIKRNNSYKDDMTPAQIIQEDIIYEHISLIDEDLLLIDDLLSFKPMITDYHTEELLKFFKQNIQIKAG